MMNNNSTDSTRETKQFGNASPGWIQTFAVAGRGIKISVTQEKSFIAHFAITAGVIVAGLALGISRWEWCVVVLCVMAGLGTELLNTSIERLSKAVTQEYDPHVRDALDIASGAVSIVAIGAALLGALVLGNALWEFMFSKSV